MLEDAFGKKVEASQKDVGKLKKLDEQNAASAIQKTFRKKREKNLLQPEIQSSGVEKVLSRLVLEVEESLEKIEENLKIGVVKVNWREAQRLPDTEIVRPESPADSDSVVSASEEIPPKIVVLSEEVKTAEKQKPVTILLSAIVDEKLKEQIREAEKNPQRLGISATTLATAGYIKAFRGISGRSDGKFSVTIGDGRGEDRGDGRDGDSKAYDIKTNGRFGTTEVAALEAMEKQSDGKLVVKINERHTAAKMTVTPDLTDHQLHEIVKKALDVERAKRAERVEKSGVRENVRRSAARLDGSSVPSADPRPTGLEAVSKISVEKALTGNR